MQLSISNKDILRLAAPISLSLVIPQVSFLANTVFLGRLGEQELAVNAMAGIFYMILSMIGAGLANGIQVQMARRAGEGDHVALARSFTNGMMLSLIIGTCLIAASFVLAPLIFTATIHDETTLNLSLTFLSIRVWGLPFIMLTQIANSFYIATGQSKYLVYGTLISTVVNVALDYALILGNWGMPQWGLVGAAVASVIAEIAFGVAMYGIFYAKRMQLKFPILSTSRFDKVLARRSLIISAPLVVQYLFSIGGWQVFFIFVEHLGTRELAVSQIMRSVFGLAGIGLWAFASACNTIVSNVIGQRKQRLVTHVIWRVTKLAVMYALILGSLLLIFPGSFLSLYRDDPSLVAFAIPSLRVIAVATVIMAVATVLFNGVMGTGNTRMNLLIEVICVGVYIIYCYIVIEKLRMPLHWAWASEFVYWSTLVIASLLYLRTGRWKNKMV